MTYNITQEQIELLKKHGINVENDIDEVLDELDILILKIGFTKDQNFLNKTGVILQKLYDDIYYQNEDEE